jgi:hypothetical protein
MKNIIKYSIIIGLSVVSPVIFPSIAFAQECFDHKCIRESGDYVLWVGSTPETWTIYNPKAHTKKVRIYVSSAFQLRGKTYKAGELSFQLKQYESTKITILPANKQVEITVWMSTNNPI